MELKNQYQLPEVKSTDITTLYFSVCSINPNLKYGGQSGGERVHKKTTFDFEESITRVQFREILEQGVENKIFRNLAYVLINELRIWNPQSHSGIKIGLGKQESLDEPQQIIDEEKLAKEISIFKKEVHAFLKDELGCPFVEFFTNFEDLPQKFLLFDLLSSEIKAQRLYEVKTRGSEISKLATLKRSDAFVMTEEIAKICDTLKVSGTFTFPEDGALALKEAEKNISDIFPNIPKTYLGPLVDLSQFSNEQMAKLNQVNESFKIEYGKRKVQIAHKFKITSEYLLNTEKVKSRMKASFPDHVLVGLKAEIDELIKIAQELPNISIEYDLKGAKDVLIIKQSQKTSSQSFHDDVVRTQIAEDETSSTKKKKKNKGRDSEKLIDYQHTYPDEPGDDEPIVEVEGEPIPDEPEDAPGIPSSEIESSKMVGIKGKEEEKIPKEEESKKEKQKKKAEAKKSKRDDRRKKKMEKMRDKEEEKLREREKELGIGEKKEDSSDEEDK